MTIAALGLNLNTPGSYSAASGASQTVKALEHQKAVLQQKLEKARNRFALSQSDEYKKLKKQLSETEQQLMKAKAGESATRVSTTVKAQEAQKTEETQETQQQEEIGSSVGLIKQSLRDRYDTFTHGEETPSAGIYKLTRSENGERAVQYEKANDEKKKNPLYPFAF